MQDRPRILFVHNFCTHYTQTLFERLARQHCMSVLFFSSGGEWYWLKEHGIRHGAFPHQYLRGFEIAGTRITPGLIWRLLFGTYDICVKCINGRFALPVTYLCTKLRRKPFVLYTGIWTRLQGGLHPFILPLVLYIYRHADAIVVYGDHVKQYLISEGVEADRIFVAPHAIDNEGFARKAEPEDLARLRENIGVPPDARIILYVGRLVRIKGLEYLLNAVSEIQDSNYVLVVAGTGSELNELSRLASSLGLQGRVRFLGYCPQDRIWLHLANAWVLVLPSVSTNWGKEPWGLVINEAFNQGVPVIATDAVGAAAGGLVRDGENGFVVPERNSSALAAALDRVLKNADLRAKLSANARETIAHWNQDRMAAGFSAAIAYAGRSLAGGK